ncbi:hypothetical protein UFOVP1370_34 [uncultured Caudovirales phage]|uniref:Uncharacterized protein n=1 Tax=uncultured Caudovirales phage TaxID=2100421 RepID=A0A6J5S523_9CAUD|nr:hypothetical protein UFOVP1370_34 [uncultured Caudovirales phage]
MDARYIKATTVLPHQNKVCGKTLRPFCLRHRVMLEAVDSPFLEPGKKKFDPLGVILAVRILSNFDKEKMSGEITFIEKLYMIRMAMSKKYFSRCVGLIIGCINVSLSYPKLWQKDEGKQRKSETLPYPLSCISNLVRNGVGLEEAWTMPEGEAVWMSVANAIYQGAKIDVLSTDEEKDLEKFNERIEAYKKSQNHN